VLRRAAVLALALLAAACGGDSEVETITVAGQPVAVAPLIDAHAALCQAAAEPDAARRHFFDRAHDQLHTVAKALEDVDRAQAAQLLQAKERVESELSDPPASLPDDLRRLAVVYRDGLGRLAITAPPCDK
jgi:MoxR-like ATPase